MSNESEKAVSTAAANEAFDVNRLPCRGCTSDCKNYQTCNGRPWREEKIHR